MQTTRTQHASTERSRPQQGVPLWARVVWGVGLAIVLVLAGVSVGVLIERERRVDMVTLSEDWQELGTVIRHLEGESYYRPAAEGEAAEWREELERQAIEGLLDGSGDNHAAFLPPDEAAASSAALTGEYEGVGITIVENDEGRIEIVSIKLDSPAQRADVRVGDIVRSVNGTPVSDGDLEGVSDLLRGDAGTRVTVGFDRPGGEPYEVTMTRERLSTGESTVAYRYFNDQNIAVIRISLFALTTTDELDRVLEQVEADGADRLVIDLRGNPGGWVSEARSVIGRFVDSSAGPALLEDTWPAGDGMLPLPIDDEGADRYTGDVLVLVDQNSASASEIVASALQHHERARVVGEQTFGKGSVQRVYDLESGESLRLTIAEWYGPGEERLEGVGVAPDIVLDPTADVEDLVPALADIFDGVSASVGSTPAATPTA